MAPSKIYKHYFNDPTLSDLVVHLKDRSVHVHRIVLCRGSKYFDKLITTGFKESGQKEIELHDDNPKAMMVLLRYIYDLPQDFLEEERIPLNFLANVYVAADKYLVDGLKEEIHQLIKKHERVVWILFLSDDFMHALKTIFTETTPKDKIRATMINACVKHILFLRRQATFTNFLQEHADVATEIIAHKNLDTMLDGAWMCDGLIHAEAVPACSSCRIPFLKSYVRSHRDQRPWTCRVCRRQGNPTCWECEPEDEERVVLTWEWYEEEIDG